MEPPLSELLGVVDKTVDTVGFKYVKVGIPGVAEKFGMKLKSEEVR